MSSPDPAPKAASSPGDSAEILVPCCTLCGDVATYVITTGTESVAVCAAELTSFIDAGLDDLHEPFVVVRRA